MKRAFTTALCLPLVVVAMIGCAKSDLLSTPEGNAMSFSTHLSNATKGEIKTDFKIGDQFGIMATESSVAWSNNDATWYLGGGSDSYISVTNTPDKGGATTWKYNPVKMWPEVNKVSFFAFYPVASATNGISNVQAVKGSPTLDFKVNDDIKSQVDLLRAEALNKFEEDVELPFGHALTRISFAAKANVSATQRVRLDKITMKGIKNSGKLAIFDANRTIGALDDMGGWSAQAGAVDYVPALSHEVASLVPSELVPMTMEDQAMFMVPQQFTVGAGAVLEVVYSYSNDNGHKWINNSKFVIDLGEYTQYWNPGKSYRYVLTLSPANIYSFSADIIDWDTEINVSVKNPLSVASMSIDPTGGKPREVTVTETRGLEMGYTLKSSEPTWLKISDKADGTGAAGEVVYDKSGNITTKAYDISKKWYVITLLNTTDARTGYVELIREGMDPIKLNVSQGAGNPFKNVDVAALASLSAYRDSPTTKIEGMVVPNGAGLTHKLKTAATWFTMSFDGQGDGVHELNVKGNPTNTPVTFYIHLTSDIKRVAKNGTIQFETTNAEGLTGVLSAPTIKQNANTEVYVGNFGGRPVVETVGTETHYYYSNGMFATTTSQFIQWSPANTVTGVVDKLDGKGNTAKLAALGGGSYPAANSCYTKTTGSVPAGTWYLAAWRQSVLYNVNNQTLGITDLNQYDWSSTEATSSNAHYRQFFRNYTTGGQSKVISSPVRCARDGVVSKADRAITIIKNAQGGVIIDVNSLGSADMSTSTVNQLHNYNDMTRNKVYKKFQVAKNNLPDMPWTKAMGISQYFDSQDATGQTQGVDHSLGCRGYSEPGASDGSWRAPTLKEMLLMWSMQELLASAGITFSAGRYITSTQGESTTVQTVAFPDDLLYAGRKDNYYPVRCIREVN